MSVSEATRIRLTKIKSGLMKGETNEQIGNACGVSERTIRRDKESWVQTPDFDIWLKTEWLRFHQKIAKEDPVEVYRQLSKMLGKSIVQKIEAKTEVSGALTVKLSAKLIKDDTSTTP